ncbi:MAG: DUF362 domain-containing protein [Actinobacteria bacterium]|nr:DUF362 domain-containing protein [Actinomycetota bacterium]
MSTPRRSPRRSTGSLLAGITYPLFSFLCLLWLVIRSGRKPSRLRYPCQQAAMVHSGWLLALGGAWCAASFRRTLNCRARAVPLLLLFLAVLPLSLGGQAPARAVASLPDVAEARVRAASLLPATWQAADPSTAHDIFVVNHVPRPVPGSSHHPGVDALVHYMGEGGLFLYRSDRYGNGAGPGGLIARDDVVLIKVNAAFDQRGMTNTDVVKGLIAAVLEHPDGFTGEVVVVENCEGGPDYDQVRNNAEDTRQSFRAVVDSFGDPSRVSASSWWSFTDNLVGEFDVGDFRQGYVNLGNNVSYPKFITGRGTCVSLRHGIWTGSGYDKSRMKLINVPVLKSHNATGVTACLKNFMGVPSIHMTTNVHHDLIFNGFMGRMMNEVIYPCLNILDAIWVSPSHPDGPAGPYSKAVRTDILLAGTDPVALDWYAAKHVLLPVSGYGRHDPDTPFGENTNPYHDGTRNTGYPYNALRIMLESTARVLAAGGHDVTLDPTRITVHLRDMRWLADWSGGHCVLGTGEARCDWYFAEGTTREGFEEWLCLQNPQGEAVAADLTFYGAQGEVTPHRIWLPPHSRTTVNVNHLLGPGRDLSVHVHTSLPTVAERPMYFLYRGSWSGGHCVLGTGEARCDWYFAEGTTREGFEEWLCLQNPQGEAVAADLTFYGAQGEVTPHRIWLPPHSRTTVNVNHLLGPGRDLSVHVHTSLPTVAERPMYFRLPR